MNARIDMYSPEEVAKSVGVTSATICNWCREELINCNKVGDGTKSNRYEITEDEYRHLRDLARKYGPKKVLLYYRKDWSESVKNPANVPGIVIKENENYETSIVANYLGIDKSNINNHCRSGKINCSVKDLNDPRGYKKYVIPGWEVLYLKSLYDKYGRNGGRNGALSHYIKDRNLRGDKNMDWSLDMDQVEDDNKFDIPVVKAVENEDTGVIDYIRKSTEPKIVETSTPEKELSGFDKAWNDVREISKVEPSDDELLDKFIKVRELKRDIDNYEAKLNQMKNEYAYLKGEITEWL